MSRIAMDTRAQNSWKELIEKEANTRIQCKLKLEEDKKNADEWFVRSKYTQTQKPPLVPAADLSGTEQRGASLKTLKSITYPPRPKRQDPGEEIAKLTEQIKASGVNLLSDMKKPEERVTDLLYDGFSKEGKGRSQYLKKRKADGPDDKYEYPLVSSFDYGWKLNEVAGAQYKNPIHGRSKIVEESFYRRNGVF
jgi:hypothetical protein